MKARLVNVILVENGSDRSYFTLEGVEIGGFKEGKQELPKPIKPPKHKGGVVGRLTPQEVRKEKEVETEHLIDKIRSN